MLGSPKKQMTVKNKAILAIMLIFMTLSGVLLFSGIHRYRTDLEFRIENNALKANRVIEQVIHNVNESYSMIINSMIENQEIIQAFKARDRNLLYTKALPFHNQMKKDNPHYSNHAYPDVAHSTADFSHTIIPRVHIILCTALRKTVTLLVRQFSIRYRKQLMAKICD